MTNAAAQTFRLALLGSEFYRSVSDLFLTQASPVPLNFRSAEITFSSYHDDELPKLLESAPMAALVCGQTLFKEARSSQSDNIPDRVILSLSKIVESICARWNVPILCSNLFCYIHSRKYRSKNEDSLLEQLRRCNLALAQYSQTSGIYIVDFDRCFRTAGYSTLQTDWKLEGSKVAELAAQEICLLLEEGGVVDEFFEIAARR